MFAQRDEAVIIAKKAVQDYNAVHKNTKIYKLHLINLAISFHHYNEPASCS